jgi:hypothetical protein
MTFSHLLQIKALFDPEMNVIVHDKHRRRGCRFDIPISVDIFLFFSSRLQNFAGQLSTQW